MISEPSERDRKLVVGSGQKHDNPRKPQETTIPARGTCAFCMYNIPPGTLMIIIPGISILIIGAVMTPLGHLKGYNNGMLTAGIIFLAMGGILTLLGLCVCCTSLGAARAEEEQRTANMRPRPQVQLISMQDSRAPSGKHGYVGPAGYDDYVIQT